MPRDACSKNIRSFDLLSYMHETNPGSPLIIDLVTLRIQRSRAGYDDDCAARLEIITMTRSTVCLSAPTPPWPENLRTSECSWRDRETQDSDASPICASHIIKHDRVGLYFWEAVRTLTSETTALYLEGIVSACNVVYLLYDIKKVNTINFRFNFPVSYSKYIGKTYHTLINQ